MIEEVKPNFYARQNAKGEWRQVWPIKKDLNKPYTMSNINWHNLILAKWKTTLTIMLIVLIASYGYHHDTKVCREFQRDPYKWCLALNLPNLRPLEQEKEGVIIENLTLNLTQGNNNEQRLFQLGKP